MPLSRYDSLWNHWEECLHFHWQVLEKPAGNVISWIPAFFPALGGTSPSGGQAREERLTDRAPASPVLSAPALLQGFWLLQLHIDTATFPKLPGGPVMSEKGLEILGWTLCCELQPRFHPLSSARAGGDQIVISTSGLNPVREMLWCHTQARTYTHTQGLTSIRLWWHPRGFRRWRCEWRENLAVHQLPTTIYLAFLTIKYSR